MKVLVVGGCGFLGRHICDRLVGRGIEVTSLHRAAVHADRSTLLKCVQLSYTDIERTKEHLAGQDALIHLGSQSVPRTSVNLGVAGILSEVEANALLFEAAADSAVRRVAFASSGGSVYGECQSGAPITELHSTMPITPHGLLKLMTELSLSHVARVTGQDATSLRVGNIYGPGQTPQTGFGVVPTFLRNILSNRTSEIWGAEVVRDYIYVEDTADAFVRAVTDSAELPSVLNIGTGKGHSALAIYNALQELTGKSVPISVAAKPVSDPAWNVLDTQLSENVLGSYAQTPLLEGLKKTVSWVRELDDSFNQPASV